MKNRKIQREIKGRYKCINGFSVIETSFISLFAGGSYAEVILDIGRAIKYLKDNVLSELSRKAPERLRDIPIKNQQDIVL